MPLNLNMYTSYYTLKTVHCPAQVYSAFCKYITLHCKNSNLPVLVSRFTWRNVLLCICIRITTKSGLKYERRRKHSPNCIFPGTQFPQKMQEKLQQIAIKYKIPNFSQNPVRPFSVFTRSVRPIFDL